MIETTDMHIIAIKKIPALRLYFDMLHEKWGEVLPALYFGTPMVKLVQKLYQYSVANPDNQKASKLVSEILETIEEFANDTNPRILDIIGTGFAEGMWIAGKDYEALIALVGPRTKKMILDVEANDRGKPTLTDQELTDAGNSHKYLDKIIKLLVEE